MRNRGVDQGEELFLCISLVVQYFFGDVNNLKPLCGNIIVFGLFDLFNLNIFIFLLIYRRVLIFSELKYLFRESLAVHLKKII